jgi:phage terminase large subunit-like protein
MTTVAPKWIRNPSDVLAISQGCWFDEDSGNDVIDFIESFCKQSQGRWAGEPLILLDWQRDFLMRLFGWKRPDGLRRFKRAYLEVAKKNGKSTMISAFCLVLLLIDREGSPQVFLNACDKEQASIVFDEAKRMVEKSPELAKRLDVVDSRKTIYHAAGDGKIVANSAEIEKKDGLNPSGVVFDELHRQRNRKMWNIFKYAAVAREQAITVAITTAGDAEEGIWFEQREYSEKVNAGVIPDTTHLGVVYRALPTDDIDDPATWAKANPSMGHTIKAEDFSRELEEAKLDPGDLANFMRLRLNIVCRGDTQFVTLEMWDRGNVPVIIIPHAPAYAGLDLSETQDLTALAILFEDDDESISVIMRFWLPDANILDLERKHNQPYRAWADKGLITLTPGNVVDYAFVRKAINDVAGDFDLRKLLIDPYNAAKLSIELAEQDGLPCESIRQGFYSLNSPTKQLKRLILSGRIHHGGNPIMRWHASNAVTVQDSAGSIKLCKRKSQKKIDGMAALVNAVAAWDAGDGDGGPSVYEQPGRLFL